MFAPYCQFKKGVYVTMLVLLSEMRKMQCIARDHSRRIFQENEMLKAELENQRKELEWRCKELDKRHAQNGFDERKLIDEKRKVIILPCQNLVCI